jgi:hypothetical protein
MMKLQAVQWSGHYVITQRLRGTKENHTQLSQDSQHRAENRSRHLQNTTTAEPHRSVHAVLGLVHSVVTGSISVPVTGFMRHSHEGREVNA